MIHLLNANALHIPLAANTVQCVITSPPYWGLRDYGTAEWVGGSGDCDHVRPSETMGGMNGKQLSNTGSHTTQYKAHCPKCGAIRKDAQLGLEATPDEFLANMVSVFREVWRVLKDDGCIWVNMGDSYSSQGKMVDDKEREKSIAQTQPKVKSGQYAKGSNWENYHERRNRNALGFENGLPSKNLIGMPWRLAFALQSDGWILRSDIIWHKPNPMPESVTDRPTKAHEYVFLLSKQGRYFYDADAVRERVGEPTRRNTEFRGETSAYKNNLSFNNNAPIHSYAPRGKPSLEGRNRRTVWTVATQPYSGSHFATFPTALIEPMILAGSRPGDLVMDPFSGTATVGEVSRKHHRRYVGLELNPKYIELAKERTRHIQPTLLDFNSVMA